MTRPCHIGACGRSDPCRVPFIVHSVFALRNMRASKWTREAEDVFTRGLARAVRIHSPDVGQLFDAGDIKVTLVRPWFAGEERNLDEGIRGTQARNDEELGLQVVVEISVFNRNVNLPTNEGRRLWRVAEGYTSEAIANMMKNITKRFNRDRTPRATCEDADLYQLAKQSLRVSREVLSKSNFMSILIAEVKEEDMLQELTASESRLVAAWTIRTDLDDDINYFGPPIPLYKRLLIFFLSLLWYGSVFVSAWVCWSYVEALCLWRFPGLRRYRSMLDRSSRYQKLDHQEEDSDDDTTTASIAVETEMAVRSHYSTPRSVTTVKQRKSPV